MAGMKGLKKKRRIQVIALAFVALALSAGLIGYAFRDGINLYRSPSQVLEEPPEAREVFQIGGLVTEGSLVLGEGTEFVFEVSDGIATVPVRYVGNDIRPDLFGEGQGTIATGTYVNGTFLATKVLAKHDESYMPKEVIDTLKETGVYVEPES